MNGGAFSQTRILAVGMAGLGAVAASSVQASGDFGLGQNTRDLLLAGVALMAATWGGANFRMFAVGFGAAAVGSLIRRNILTAV